MLACVEFYIMLAFEYVFVQQNLIIEKSNSWFIGCCVLTWLVEFTFVEVGMHVGTEFFSVVQLYIRKNYLNFINVTVSDNMVF